MSTVPKLVPDIAPSHLVVKAHQIPTLDMVLAGIFPLTPPLTPKGRYALAKAAKIIGPAHQTYLEQKVALLVQHAVKVDGKPVTQQLPNGATQYDLGKGFGVTTPEFDADLKAMNDEDIPLVGCRMITHAELGECPITLQQETALLGVLLVDAEPE